MIIVLFFTCFLLLICSGIPGCIFVSIQETLTSHRGGAMCQERPPSRQPFSAEEERGEEEADWQLTLAPRGTSVWEGRLLLGLFHFVVTIHLHGGPPETCLSPWVWIHWVYWRNKTDLAGEHITWCIYCVHPHCYFYQTTPGSSHTDETLVSGRSCMFKGTRFLWIF